MLSEVFPRRGKILGKTALKSNGGVNPYSYANNNPLRYDDPYGLVAETLTGAEIGGALGGLPGAIAGGIIGTIGQIAAGAALGGIVSAIPSDTPKKNCPEDGCPPCRTVSGKTVPVGTIGYRPLDTPAPGNMEHGIVGPHYNIYKANQNPNNCRCFWQPQGAVPPSALPPGAIPIEPFAN